MLQSTNDSLQQQLIHLKLSYESTKKHLDEERQQLSQMIEMQRGLSVVKSQFVKERVDQRLSDLYETLQGENAKLKIEISEYKAKTQILENSLRITTENYEAMSNSQRQVIANLKAQANQEESQVEQKEDTEMKESYVEPTNDDHLDSLKSVIIEQ